MDTIVVTGGAGFIGANFVRQALARHRRARGGARQAHLRRQPGEPGATSRRTRATRSSRRTSPTAPRCAAVFARAPPDGRRQLRRRDRTSTARSTARARSCARTSMGTFELLEAARRYWHAATSARASASASCTSRPTRCTAPRPDGQLHARRTPYAPNSPYAASKAAADHLVRAYYHTLRPAGADHELLEQLRPVPVPREADPAHDPERRRGEAAADLRRRRQRARLALRRGPLRRHPARARSEGAPGEKYNIGGGNERTNLEVVDALCAVLDAELPAAPTRRSRRAA